MTMTIAIDESCASCGASMHGGFCAACGERRLDHHDLSLRHFLQHSLHDVTHFDTKIFRSMGVLLRHPGRLTREYFAGRRIRFLTPVQLFVMINVIFFFAAPKLGLFRFGYDYYVGNRTVLAGVPTKKILDEVRGDRSVEEFRTEFDHAIDSPKRLLIFTMVAMFALALAILMRRRFLVEHTVFALHYYAFWMLMMILLPLLLLAGGSIAAGVFRAVTGRHASVAFADPILLTLTITASIAYLYVAIREFYGSSRRAAFIQGTILSVGMVAIFLIYRGVLFLLGTRLV
jgi:hypothetical protein